MTRKHPLDSELSRLPEPSPPAGLTVAIILRTAHHDEKRAAASPAKTRPAKTQYDRYAWAVLLAGVAIGLGAQAYRLLVGESTLPLASSFIRGGTKGLIEMPQASPAVFVLVAGLLLYIVGLFALSTTALPPRDPA